MRGIHLTYENEVRSVVAGSDKDAPVFDFRSFTDEVALQTAQPRFEAALVSGFAVIALLLSAVGLYAVLAFVVADRTRELGLRMALGADRSDILHLVMQRGLVLACIGIGTGLLASVFATQLVNDMLFNVGRLDRAVFLMVSLVLLLVSIAAALVPAVRAAQSRPHAHPSRTIVAAKRKARREDGHRRAKGKATRTHHESCQRNSPSTSGLASGVRHPYAKLMLCNFLQPANGRCCTRSTRENENSSLHPTPLASGPGCRCPSRSSLRRES